MADWPSRMSQIQIDQLKENNRSLAKELNVIRQQCREATCMKTAHIRRIKILEQTVELLTRQIREMREINLSLMDKVSPSSLKRSRQSSSSVSPASSTISLYQSTPSPSPPPDLQEELLSAAGQQTCCWLLQKEIIVACSHFWTVFF